MRKLLFTESESEALPTKIAISRSTRTSGNKLERTGTTIITGEDALAVAASHIDKVAVARRPLVRDDREVTATTHLASRSSSESLI